MILPRTNLGPHRQHYFQLENVEGKEYTHVRLTIYPDGGLQRIRVVGKRPNRAKAPPALPLVSLPSAPALLPGSTKGIPLLPLTPEAFAPFGQVVQAYGDPTRAPKGTRTTPANGGSATKFHKLALIEASYPSGLGATTGISVYRCNPSRGRTMELKNLERHRFTNQAFIPMGQSSGDSGDSGRGYIVVVAQSGGDQKPDMQTLKGFIASSMQGIVYGKAIWHQPMTVLDRVMDFACVETQIGDGNAEDCEIVDLDGSYELQLPE